jgi:hypothetical protein
MKSPRGAERSQDLGVLENAPNKSSQLITTFDLLLLVNGGGFIEG